MSSENPNPDWKTLIQDVSDGDIPNIVDRCLEELEYLQDLGEIPEYSYHKLEDECERLLELCDDEENLLYPTWLIRIYLFDGKGKIQQMLCKKSHLQYSTISIKILNLEKIFLHS